MFKRCTLLLLVCMLLTGGLCTARAAISNEDLYASAQNELLRYLNGENSKTLDELCADFESLGLYQKSTSFLYYVSLLRDAAAEQFTQIDVYVMLLSIDTDFGALLDAIGLPSVEAAKAYAKGRQAEAAQDDRSAIAYYQQCGAMLDSLPRLRQLLLATPAPTPVPTPAPTPKAVAVKENVKAGDYVITAYSDGSCEITAYNGKAAVLEIPERLQGYRVTAIGKMAFSECNTLTSVILPGSVTVVGDYAFGACESLSRVHIPDSVVSVGGNPFRKCGRLTQIDLSPDHPVLSLADGVLFDHVEQRLICYPCALQGPEYAIPQGTRSVGTWALAFSHALTGIQIPSNVTLLDDYACYNSRKLISVAIPGNVTSVGKHAFSFCAALTNVTIAGGVTSIGDNAFRSCSDLIGVTLPQSVTSIGEHAFIYCRRLVLCVPAGSHAHQYAEDNLLRYTTY